MTKNSRLSQCSIFLLFVSYLLNAQISIAQPSVEDFVKHPHFEAGKISPSGKYLAVTRRKLDQQGILVVNLDTMKVESGTHFGKHEDVWDFTWANDERLLIEPALRAPATMSYKAPTGELMGMDADGSNLRYLSGFRLDVTKTGTLLYKRNPVKAQSDIFDLYLRDPDQVLVTESSSRVRGGYSSAYLLNINNGTAKVVGRSKTRFGHFIADENGHPAINIGENSEYETELYYRSNGEESFELLSKSQFGKGVVIPLAAIPNGGGYYVLENHSGNTKGLSIWHPDKVDSFEVVFRHATVDIDSVIMNVENNKLVAIKYYDPLPNYFYPDQNLPLVKHHQRLRTVFPNRDIIIESFTTDLSKAVINITGDVYPSTYYLLDVNSGAFDRIFLSRPELNADQLATMQAITVTARDGLELQGFLTLPKNHSNQAMPTIVLVHGGPYGLRDHWGYDFEVQLLASRGYAVLQVNFRGSSGAGLAFQAAGIGQWGAKMQDDITDATHWAIEQGIANPNKICIYGSSYDGYAALMGVVREPDLYKCAVGYGGVYDLVELQQQGAIQATEAGDSYLQQVLGSDKTQLQSRSPVFQVNRIRAKVMLAHGKKDTIAPIQQVESMRTALKNVGNEPKYFIENKEGHGFFGQKSRQKYYTKLLAFFDENIGGNNNNFNDK